MAWLEAHQELRGHPKIAKLGRSMGWDYFHALGHIMALWLWCLQYAIDGDLSEFDNNQIADAAGVNQNDADMFVSSLTACKLLDNEPKQRIHDWWTYAGRFIQGKYGRKPKEWESIQKEYDTSVNKRRLQTVSKRLPTVSTTVPNSTVPNITVPNTYKRKPKNRKSLFAYILKQYPNTIRSKDCKRHFDATVLNIEDWENINIAIKKYLEHLKIETWKKPQNASTWFNNWKDWVNYKELKKETVYYTPDGIPIR